MILFFCLKLLAVSLWAQALVDGQFKSSTDYYPAPINEDLEDLVPWLELELKGKAKISRPLRFQWQAFAMGNLVSKHDPEKIYADLPEAYLEYRLSDVRLRAGMNTLNWGVVDLNSPSDVVNPSALLHPLRNLKRGAPMVELEWKRQYTGLHLVYIPRQQRSLMPAEDSRWLPRTMLLNLTADGRRVLIPDDIEYKYLAPETLDHALDHNAGIRFNTTLDRLDLSAMHFEGAHPSAKARPVPLFDFTSIPGELLAVSPIELALVSYRVRTSGLGAVWAGDAWIFRAESVYQHTISEDELLQPWAWSNVFAVETNFNVGTRTLTVLSQFYFTENPQKADNLVSSSYRLFDRSVLLALRYPYSDGLIFTGSILYESNTTGFFALAGFEQKLSDVLRFGMSWRDFSAQQNGLLKTFDRNDHATLDLTYYF